MQITSLGFLMLFLPAMVAVFYFPLGKLDGLKRKLVLVGASIAFYSLGNFQWLILLLLSIGVNFALTRLALFSGKTKAFGTVAIVLDVAVLISFKYINVFLGLANIGIDTIAFPLGLSYYTFMAISYVVDSLKTKHRHSLLDTALYMSFFASITSGPITPFNDFWEKSDLEKARFRSVFEGAERVAFGLIKKVMIANILGYLADDCFGKGAVSVLMAWGGAIAYTLQIYFDFSGYSDMAIGIGQMFGITLSENFDYPYASNSISVFWKKWHMSLTRWFTKYIYIPLGGSRVSPARHIFNLWIVWMITGLWHGNGWTFILWAMLHFVVQLMEKKAKNNKIPTAIGHIYTMVVVTVGWCIFRSANLAQALGYVGNMFGLGCTDFADAQSFALLKGYAMPLLFGCAFAVPLYPFICKTINKSKVMLLMKDVLVVIAFVAAVLFQMNLTASAPLYAGF